MSRPAMRLLSSRLAHLRPQQPRFQLYARPLSTRYSQPPARSALDSTFVAETKADTTPVTNSNPYIKDDSIGLNEEAQRRYKRLRYATFGLFFSVIAFAGVSWKLLQAVNQENQRRSGLQLDAHPDAKGAEFQGRPVKIVGAGEDKRITAEGDEDVDLVETGTSSVPYFPKVVYLPSSSTAITGGAKPNTSINPGNLHNDEEYTLIGLGIRTVSIFSIQVYVLGLYVRTADLSTLQSKLIHYVNQSASTLVPSEKDDLRSALLDASKSTELWSQIFLDTSIKSAWRISPTRNTDFAHLRDGWITGIKRGTQAATLALRESNQGSTETEYETESFGDSVKTFKDIFHGGGRTAKGSVVTLARDELGGVDIFFEDPAKNEGQEKLGRVQDPRIGKLVWFGYLAGKDVSSEAARRGVAEGCLVLAARPVGSAETMVT